MVDDHLSVKGVHILIREEMEGVNGRSGIGHSVLFPWRVMHCKRSHTRGFYAATGCPSGTY